jgi:hypothetical protein
MIARSTQTSRSRQAPPTIDLSRACRDRPGLSAGLVLGWVLKITGVLAAVVFGIWAPVTYRLQIRGNASSDKSQEKMMKKLKEVVMRVEGVEQEVEMRMGGLARLRVWEFCEGKGRRVSLAGFSHVLVLV